MAETRGDQDTIERDSRRCRELLEYLGQALVGQESVLEHLLLAVLCRGHVLLEGVPGLGKTLAVRSFAAAVQGRFSRIQLTPDLLPGDVTGTEVFLPDRGVFEPRLGPVVTNFLLADEINRAPAKVQSALLEAMEERQVTVGGQTFPLPTPFVVMATQNPIELEGTYPLPEAQIDRFLFKVAVRYPAPDAERAVVDAHLASGIPAVQPMLSLDELDQLTSATRTVRMDGRLREYCVRLTRATRPDDETSSGDIRTWVRYGASPRAAVALAVAARGLALVRGRGFVIPEDVKEVAPAVLRHRLVLTLDAQAEEIDPEELLAGVLLRVDVP